MKRTPLYALLCLSLLICGCEPGSFLSDAKNAIAGPPKNGKKATAADKTNGKERPASTLESRIARDELSLKENLPQDLPLELQWTVPVIEGRAIKLFIPSPKTKLEFLIIQTDNNSYIAVDRKNGRARWITELGSYTKAAPAFTPHSVFTIVDNHLINLSQQKGEVIWKLRLDFPSTGHLVAFEEELGNPFFVMPSLNRLVYGYNTVKTVWPPKRGAGSLNRKDIMIKRTNLHMLWKYPTEGLIEGQAGYKGGFAYVSDSKRKVYAVNSINILNNRPELTWKGITRGPNSSGVTIGGAYALVTSRDQNIYCYLRRTGSLAWRFEAGEQFTEPAVFTACPFRKEVALVARSSEGSIFCIATQKGKLLWKRDKPGKIVALDDQVDKADKERTSLVIAYEDGSMEAVQFATGASVWKVAKSVIGFTAENPIEKSVYAVSTDGKTVFALRRR
ncbi:MAG: outer membrane protein assembly factor BamB family protein [Planctomycetota bacterium]